jgi:hypothetical protein
LTGLDTEVNHSFGGNSKNNILALAAGLVLAGVLLLILELVFSFLIEEPPAPEWQSKQVKMFFSPDSILGYSPPKDAVVNATKRSRSGGILYDVTYTFNHYGRRNIPNQFEREGSSFALFFGCSFTFGEGLNDNETLPFYFSRQAHDVHPYNFAFSGYGPNQMCEILGSQRINEEIAEVSGILFYIFIDEHISRAIGSMYVFNLWCRKCPYFQLENDGSVQRHGNFSTGRPIRSFIYRLLGKSNILRYCGFDWPAKIDDDAITLTAGLIAESRNRFLARYATSKFVVVFYPGSRYSTSLIPLLQSYGISYLDYSEMINLRAGRNIITEEDKHPSSLANEVLAKRLLNDIAEDFNR